LLRIDTVDVSRTGAIQMSYLRRALPVLLVVLATPAHLAGQGPRTDPGGPAVSPDSVVEFRLTVARTADGIAATCHEGCTWETLEAGNARGIYRVTEHGIEPERDPERAARPDATPSFSIILNTSGDGIAALCDRGCAWTAASAVNSEQRYRVDERGILTGRADGPGR
jgi:hypothetical protein